MTARQTELLIVGGESDPNTQRVVDQAHLRDVDYFFWDTDKPHACQIAWDLDRPEIDLGNLLLQPRAIYIRYNVFGGDTARNHAAFDVSESFALAWPSIRMLNRATAGDSNNKSRNLVRARDCGFTIPETIVLGDLTPLAGVPGPENKIIKPLAGGDHALQVSEIKDDDARLGALLPQFVQEKLDGENIRVFSIGGDLFAFHLKTTEVDYRTDDQVAIVAIDVPATIREQTDRLVGQIGFDYCALDFRCRSDFDAPVFLEINSFPMFVAFDNACENRLTDAILAFLLPPGQ
jgi:glutathione synthase/RimK-type ligase-like ATP-grasp enzyme